MPLHYLIALFIGLPVVELALLFKVHDLVGWGPTILLVLLTGVAGACCGAIVLLISGMPHFLG